MEERFFRTEPSGLIRGGVLFCPAPGKRGVRPHPDGVPPRGAGATAPLLRSGGKGGFPVKYNIKDVSH